MKTNTIEVIDRGMRCLSENLGAKDTEIFISTILRERFDYTEWRHSLVDKIDTFQKLDAFIAESKQTMEFGGSPEVTI